MPVVSNKGGRIALAGVVFRAGDAAKPGATLVDASKLAELRSSRAFQALVAGGRLSVDDGGKSPKPPPVEALPETPPEPLSDLPVEVDGDGDGVPDLAALSAKAAASMIAHIEPADVETLDAMVEGEERKTVLDAYRKRRAELDGETDDGEG